MHLALSSAASSWVHLSVLLLITLPSVPLLIALKIKRLRRNALSFHTRQPMDCFQDHDLDDFEPDDEWCQEWLLLLTEDPFNLINTAHHLDRCHDLQSATKPHR